MRMIDADVLWTDIMMLPHNGDMISSDEVEETILNAPTVEIEGEPVTRSRWLKHAGAQNTTYWTCLNCDTLGSPRWKRCPVCEAKMEVQA